MGVRNIFCVTGDGVQTGDHPEAKPVFDLDSVTLLTPINQLKTTGKFLRTFDLTNYNKYCWPLGGREHLNQKIIRAHLFRFWYKYFIGTEEETKNFMAVCVKTIEHYPADDQLTPVFVFERLCQLIYPEEADTGEFFMTLEKDPQQEDFLQGRMLGNPYSSTEQDMGPLMREIKNKICTDCELVALLEDDNGMELLVNNKIMSLDLPVKDVYQKVWLPALASAGINNGMSCLLYTSPSPRDS